VRLAGAAGAGTRFLELARDFVFDSGARLSQVRIAYRTWGELSPRRDNAVLVCHALSGSADLDLWWPQLLGAGRVLDPARQFIVASNVLGGCYGSSGPLSASPLDGRPFGPRFPELSIRDMVRAQALLLDHLGVERLDFALGGSMGGMQVLEWIAALPERLRAAAVIAAPVAHSAWALALAAAQCAALRADPCFRGGDYAAGAGPLAGLGAARRIAMCSYRSPQALQARFARRPGRGGHAVGEWLEHHAREFAARFDANTFLGLSRAMDAHDLGAQRGGAENVLRACRVPTLALGISSDQLYPADEIEAWSACMPCARFEVWPSIHGHDAFLIEAQGVGQRIAAFRREFQARAMSR